MTSTDRVHDLLAEEWETPGHTPQVLSVLRELYLEEDGRINPGWLSLIRSLGDARATIAVAVPAGRIATDIFPNVELLGAPIDFEGHRVAPFLWGTAAQFASDLAQRADEMRTHYTRLAQHLLEAAAGLVAPGDIPEFTVMGKPGFAMPGLSVPDGLAGFALRDVRAALPDAGAGPAKDEELLALPAEERDSDLGEALRRERDRLGGVYETQAVVWSDLVCRALAGELRLVLRQAG